MAHRLLFAKILMIATALAVSMTPVESDAQRRLGGGYRAPSGTFRTQPRPPAPPRPIPRPVLPGGGMRNGPLIKPPLIRQGGFRPAGSGLAGRPSTITIKPTTFPKSGSGIGRPTGGGIAIKPGANVSLKSGASTSILNARLKGKGVRGTPLAAGRPTFRADPKVIQAKRSAAIARSVAPSIQRVRAELRKPGKALAPVQCAAVGDCPVDSKKVYQRVKAGYGIDASMLSRSFKSAVTNRPVASRQSLNIGSQNKHIRGNNGFVDTKSEISGDPKTLLEELSGKGSQVSRIPRGHPGFRERVSTGRQIGIFRDEKAPDGSPEKNGIPTDTVIIHYSKNGAHLVPARPSDEFVK